MKKKIPSVAQVALRKSSYNYPANTDLYPKKYKPTKGLDEWLYFNPWVNMAMNVNKRIYVVWYYNYGME